MSNLPIYEMPAQAFAGEDVDAVFNLMGDGNRHGVMQGSRSQI